jgi:hypothetical protein
MIPSDLSRGIAPDFASGLIPGLPRVVAPRPREISPVALTAFPASRSPYAEEFLGAASPDSSPLPWPSRSLKRSALPCSPLGAHMSTLQDSLNGTGCWCAPPSQRDTPLRHTGSPQCNGSLLRGSLAITATGLAPVSCQCLSGHTSGMLGVARGQHLALALTSCPLALRPARSLRPRDTHSQCPPCPRIHQLGSVGCRVVPEMTTPPYTSPPEIRPLNDPQRVNGYYDEASLKSSGL